MKQTIRNLKQFRKISMGIAMMLTFIVGVRAGDVHASGNPYAPIVAKNIFGLTPLVVTVTTQAIEPPVKIIPNGIISVFGQAQVLFKVAAKTGMETSYIFAEGQKKDGIEVVKIDWRKGLITFNNHGFIQKLALIGMPTTAVVPPNPQQ
jgi:hypothetical protein